MTDKPTTAQELEELFGKVDWEKVLKDKIVSIIKEDENKRLMTTLYGSSFADMIMVEPGVYKSMKYNRKMNFIEKLDASWWWMTQIFEEWCWQMTHDDGEFFNHLQTDYCKYEEDMYYTK